MPGSGRCPSLIASTLFLCTLLKLQVSAPCNMNVLIITLWMPSFLFFVDTLALQILHFRLTIIFLPLIILFYYLNSLLVCYRRNPKYVYFSQALVTKYVLQNHRYLLYPVRHDPNPNFDVKPF